MAGGKTTDTSAGRRTDPKNETPSLSRSSKYDTKSAASSTSTSRKPATPTNLQISQSTPGSDSSTMRNAPSSRSKRKDKSSGASYTSTSPSSGESPITCRHGASQRGGAYATGVRDDCPCCMDRRHFLRPLPRAEDVLWRVDWRYLHERRG